MDNPNGAIVSGIVNATSRSASLRQRLVPLRLGGGNIMPGIAIWDADDPAVSPEEVGDPPVTISLRHPSYPAEADWAGSDPAELKDIVAKYLSKARQRLGLPDLFSSGRDFKVHMA